ncbi:Dyp-type peroxidase [Dermabacteraceae bacterium P9123]
MLAATVAGGVTIAAAAGYGAGRESVPETPPPPNPATLTVPFYGTYQAGIATPAQAHLSLIAFDLPAGADRDSLRRLMRVWTDDAERLTAGRPVLTDTEKELADKPASLTVTVGFGRKVFTTAGREELAPQWLRPLKNFPTIDRLEPQWSGGDLVLQICCNDPLTLAHAERALIKDARTLATVRWVQHGFRQEQRPSGSMRNLMGQVDGTVNPPLPANERLVFIDSPNPALNNGSSLVVRRIRMELDSWDELGRHAKEQAVGRKLDTGAPLTGTKEDDPLDLEARNGDGLEVIPAFAHARRAHLDGAGQVILRRPYNYSEPLTAAEIAEGMSANSGLIFMAYQADVDRQFLPIQESLAQLDLLNQWTTPIGSAVFFIPPGVAAGEYWGQALLAE